MRRYRWKIVAVWVQIIRATRMLYRALLFAIAPLLVAAAKAKEESPSNLVNPVYLEWEEITSKITTKKSGTKTILNKVGRYCSKSCYCNIMIYCRDVLRVLRMFSNGGEASIWYG